MKKLIFCCLIVLMSSCKDKNESEPDIDFAPGFAASYWTKTADAGSGAEHTWDITATAKNQLGIAYKKVITLSGSGTSVTTTQTYDLVNVMVNSLDSFTINAEPVVTQGTTTFKQKVEGVANRVVNSAGVQQLNITLKITNSTTGVVSQEYLEFKKK